MLRIIHTGRAYEVLDFKIPVFPWWPETKLARARREVEDLKVLLKNTTNRNLELQIELESCQKSTQV